MTKEQSKKIGRKEIIHNAKEVIISQISGYYRWIQQGIKMAVSLKTFCFHGNNRFMNTKSLLTSNLFGETNSNTLIDSNDSNDDDSYALCNYSYIPFC